MANDTNKLSNLSDVFYLFCGKDSNRPVLANPFIIGEYTYATNTYSLIRCKSEKIDFKYENDEEPLKIVDNIIPNSNMLEIINIDDIDWISLMNTDETIWEGNDIICGLCNGDGSCDDNVLYKNKFYDFEYECPVCNGTGYEEKSYRKPTGNKIFSPNDVVKIKDAFIKCEYIYKLKKVKDFIGGDLELICYKDNKSSVLFRIGFLEILLMPAGIYHDYDINVVLNIM
jgi:hypothetical protein